MTHMARLTWRVNAWIETDSTMAYNDQGQRPRARTKARDPTVLHKHQGDRSTHVRLTWGQPGFRDVWHL